RFWGPIAHCGVFACPERRRKASGPGADVGAGGEGLKRGLLRGARSRPNTTTLTEPSRWAEARMCGFGPALPKKTCEERTGQPGEDESCLPPARSGLGLSRTVPESWPRLWVGIPFAARRAP